MVKPSLVIYWSRRDLRLTDNSALEGALTESAARAVPCLPLFILEDYMVDGDPTFQFGYPSRVFLSGALPRFASRFPRFALVRGKAVAYLSELSTSYTLSVHVNDDVYADFYTQIEKLRNAGITVTVYEDALSVPKETRTGEGRLYSVFTPFKKSVWQTFVGVKPRAPVRVTGVTYHTEQLPHECTITEEEIWKTFSHTRLMRVGERTIDLDTLTQPPELDTWYVDEAEACAHFDTFLTTGLLHAYDTGRDSLEGDVAQNESGREGKTSRMSLALAWGLVSSRMLMERIRSHFSESFDNPFSNRVSQGALSYISELIWREFYRYELFHHPELMHTEFQERFRGTIAWVKEDVAYERFLLWIQGETGYPVVDAAMRQLASTGWMHNRARMIVASILTKNLGVDWRWGQEYFRAALIDLDEASNNGGWQWGASVGADPKPIRIFNPELQAKNYDASGAYVGRWLYGGEEPVLKTERLPIVSHADAREEALRRYGLTKTIPRDY